MNMPNALDLLKQTSFTRPGYTLPQGSIAIEYPQEGAELGSINGGITAGKNQ